jgi:hypothetical protein
MLQNVITSTRTSLSETSILQYEIVSATSLKIISYRRVTSLSGTENYITTGQSGRVPSTKLLSLALEQDITVFKLPLRVLRYTSLTAVSEGMHIVPLQSPQETSLLSITPNYMEQSPSSLQLPTHFYFVLFTFLSLFSYSLHSLHPDFPSFFILLFHVLLF